jgi:pyruvate dehydrogenase E2 component (dihydrolipoamide acetyltransferase)
MANIVEMPKLGFDMAEGTLVRWVKLEGETIQKGDVLAEIETDKATVEVESNFSGIVFKHLAKEKESYPSVHPLQSSPKKEKKWIYLHCLAKASQNHPTGTEKPDSSQETAAVPSLQRGPSELEPSQKIPQGVKASPLARNIAKAAQIDLSLITGSGPADE